MLKEAQQIVELAMDVTHELQGRLKFEKRGLIGENGYGGLDEIGHLVARQPHIRSRFLCEHTRRMRHLRTERAKEWNDTIAGNVLSAAARSFSMIAAALVSVIYALVSAGQTAGVPVTVAVREAGATRCGEEPAPTTLGPTRPELSSQSSAPKRGRCRGVCTECISFEGGSPHTPHDASYRSFVPHHPWSTAPVRPLPPIPSHGLVQPACAHSKQ